MIRVTSSTRRDIYHYSMAEFMARLSLEGRPVDVSFNLNDVTVAMAADSLTETSETS